MFIYLAAGHVLTCLLGILLLEENIVRSDSAEEPQAKRARGASRPAAAPQNTSTWIELARYIQTAYFISHSIHKMVILK